MLYSRFLLVIYFIYSSVYVNLPISQCIPPPINCISFFLKINLFIYLFFDCVGSSFLCMGFLYLQRAGATLCCSARASYCSGFSLLQSTGSRHAAAVVVARGFSSCGSWALECSLSSCDARA